MTRNEAREKAIVLFKEGYNCSQAVMGSFAELLGMDLDTAMHLSAPFGGGFGRMREVCGAVSGMCMVLGLALEKFDPATPSDKTSVYADTQALLGQFQSANGSIICRELLAGVNATAGGVPEARTKEYYQKRPCAELVGQAAEFIWDYLSERGKI